MKKTILAVVISSISLGAIAAEHDHEHFSEIGKQGGKPATKTTIEKMTLSLKH